MQSKFALAMQKIIWQKLFYEKGKHLAVQMLSWTCLDCNTKACAAYIDAHIPQIPRKSSIVVSTIVDTSKALKDAHKTRASQLAKYPKVKQNKS